MKYIISALLGVILALTVVKYTSLTRYLKSNDLEVGSCVRELGTNNIETVTVVTLLGGVETVSNIYGTDRYWFYKDSTKLVQVECETK